MKTKCMIVDDEPLARELIAGYLKTMDNIELVAQCSNPMEAFTVLREKKIDLIFLDINMPQITGIEFLRSLNTAPKVIIISAHKEYALEGFELDVIDYLLKPVSLSRFLKALDKYYKLTNFSDPIHRSEVSSEKEFIYLKENKKVIKVFLNEIEYIEAMGEYCQVYLEGRRIIPKMSIKSFEEMLSDKNFIRIHKSIIVPIPKVTAFSASAIEVGKKKELPIGRSYKKSVIHALKYSDKVQQT